MSKFRLADQYEADFLFVGSKNPWTTEPAITLVEIESAKMRLFTRKGDPSADLTHALRQVQDWKRWVGQ